VFEAIVGYIVRLPQKTTPTPKLEPVTTAEAYHPSSAGDRNWEDHGISWPKYKYETLYKNN
jgi:hypothetical protein